MGERRGRLVFTPASEIQMRATPRCDACGKRMWWHGSTLGFGCPVPGGNPDCRVSPELRHPNRAKAGV